MHHKLRQVMLERNQGKPLDGRIGMDDAYLGGECSGGKCGRGGPGKTPFVAAVETTRGRQGPPREAAARAAVYEEEHQENHRADRDARCAGCH